MKSGMLAAEAAFKELTQQPASSVPVDLSGYEKAMKESWVWEELTSCRNIRPGYFS